MADQSIALQVQPSKFDLGNTLGAIQRLQAGEQALGIGQIRQQAAQADLSDDLIRRAATMATDGQSWDEQMQRAAQRGAPEALQYVGKYNPLLQQHVASGGADTMGGGIAGQAGPAGAAAGAAGPGGIDYATMNQINSMTPEQRGQVFQNLTHIAGALSRVHDSASWDKEIDDAVAAGMPNAEAFRGKWTSPLVGQRMADQMSQNVQRSLAYLNQAFGDQMAGLPQRVVPRPSEVTEVGPNKQPMVHYLDTGEFEYPDIKGKPTVSGDLSDPAYSSYIDSIGHYQTKAPGMRMGNRQQVIADVLSRYPQWNEGSFDINKQTVNDYIHGQTGKTVKSLNTSIDHIDTARNLISALGNNDWRSANELGQIFGKEFGSTATTNFDTARDIVMDEVAKAVIGGNNAERDRERLQTNASRASSPAQLTGVLNTLQDLMAGQMRSQRRAYEATGLTDFDEKFLSPRAREVLDRLEPRGNGGAGNSRGGGGQQPPSSDQGNAMPLPQDRKFQPGQLYQTQQGPRYFDPNALGGKGGFTRTPPQSPQTQAAPPQSSGPAPVSGGQWSSTGGQGGPLIQPRLSRDEMMSVRGRDEENARQGLQDYANRTGQTIRGTSFGDIAPQAGTTPAQPEPQSMRSSSALSRSTPLLDVSSADLQAAGRRTPNTTLTPDLDAIENSRQRISQEQNLSATGDYNRTASDVYTQGRTPNSVVEPEAIRAQLIRRLAEARSPEMRAQILQQLMINEGFASPDSNRAVAQSR